MEIENLIPAAEYVRMSTEDQKYSIPCQQAAVRNYATEHGFSICRSYIDSGKSGVLIKHRSGLNQLLQDVLTENANYKAILVYDVSRWGRFQNPDEAAHYEFICAKAGIPIHYCSEQFLNDGSMQSSLLKAVKRTMAGEFSRELGLKVFDGLKRLVLQGYHAGAIAPYGLERMLVSPTGRPKGILKRRQRKNLKTDKVVLIAGKKNEVAIVKRIFRMCANDKKTCAEIAVKLNAGNLSYRNKPWDCNKVFRILRSPQYLGLNVWARRKQTLHGPSSVRPRSQWVISKAPFKPIVDQVTFEKAQRTLARHKVSYSSEYLIATLKRVLARNKRLSPALLDRKTAGQSGTYMRRFGSLLKAYELAGFKAPPSSYAMSCHTRNSKALYKSVIGNLERLFPGNVRIVPSDNRQRKFLLVDGDATVSVLICGQRARRGEGNRVPWLLRIQPRDRNNIALLCALDPSWTNVLKYYLLQPIRNSIEGKSHVFYENDLWLRTSGRELGDLKGFLSAVRLLITDDKSAPPAELSAHQFRPSQKSSQH